jgi:hypothetical protein
MSYNKYTSYSNIKKRCEFGKLSEQETLPIIRKFFKDKTIEPTTKHFDKWDYISKTKNYEIKTRTCKYNEYPTTMITQDKCMADSILLFKFTDGLYYIEYNKQQFDKYEIKLFTKYIKPINYIYIDINDLIKIEDINNKSCDFID